MDHMNAMWHDLATRFEAGEREFTSPPLTFEDAKQMRWAFYRWRAELRDADRVSRTPMYSAIHRIVVSPRLNEETGKWVVRFMLPEVSPVYQALEAMTHPKEGEQE